MRAKRLVATARRREGAASEAKGAIAAGSRRRVSSLVEQASSERSRGDTLWLLITAAPQRKVGGSVADA
jgi:hypothetical protein